MVYICQVPTLLIHYQQHMKPLNQLRFLLLYGGDYILTAFYSLF